MIDPTVLQSRMHLGRSGYVPELVQSTHERGVATLILNRPPRNAMNIERMEQANAALLELREHSELEGRAPHWLD